LYGRFFPTFSCQLDHIGKGGVCQSQGGGEWDSSRHIGNTIMDDAVDGESRVLVRGRATSLNTASLIYRHIYQYGALFHVLQHVPCDKMGGFGTGNKDGAND